MILLDTRSASSEINPACDGQAIVGDEGDRGAVGDHEA